MLHPENTEFKGQTQYSFPEYTSHDYLKSDYVKYLREKLNNGEKLPECNKCWVNEKYNKKSFRQWLNDDLTNHKPLDKSWMNLYFKNKKDYEFDLLLSADIAVSFVCNFSCAMCNPNESSQIYNSWQNSLEEFFVKDIIAKEPSYFDKIKQRYISKNNYELLIEILNQQPKNLKILGGEPLIDKQLLAILEKFDVEKACKMNLVFITNGSVDLLAISKKLNHFKHVGFIVSLEGTEQVQDYIRKGSNWSQIKNNIENFVSVKGTQTISVAHTIQALTIYHFLSLLDWANSLKLQISFGMLTNPDFLSLSALPDSLKMQILDRYKNANTKNLIFLNENNVSDLNFNFVDLIQDSEHDYNLTNKLQQYLKWYDPEQNWKHILPEWLPYLD